MQDPRAGSSPAVRIDFDLPTTPLSSHAPPVSPPSTPPPTPTPRGSRGPQVAVPGSAPLGGAAGLLRVSARACGGRAYLRDERSRRRAAAPGSFGPARAPGRGALGSEESAARREAGSPLPGAGPSSGAARAGVAPAGAARPSRRHAFPAPPLPPPSTRSTAPSAREGGGSARPGRLKRVARLRERSASLLGVFLRARGRVRAFVFAFRPGRVSVRARKRALSIRERRGERRGHVCGETF